MKIRHLDHVSLTVSDLDDACAFYGRVLAARQVSEYRLDDRVAVRQMRVGDAVLSLHQQDNGVDLVAARPSVGAGDFCLLCDAKMDAVLAHLGRNGVKVAGGPADRKTAVGQPAQSVYFRDIDGNLVELMCPN